MNNSRLESITLLLLFSVLLLLPFHRLYELPLLLLSGLGLWQLLSGKLSLKESPNRDFLWCFGLYFWLLLLASLDSAWPQKSWLITLSSVRFLLSGLAVLSLLKATTLRRYLPKMVSLLLLFWAFDAMLQYVFSADLFGIESYPGRLSGIFGNNVKLGPVLALFLPLLLMFLSKQAAWKFWLGLTVCLLVIVLSGTRSAWLMSGFILLLWFFRQVRRQRLLKLSKMALLALLAGLLLWQVSDDFRLRIERSAAIFNGNEQGLDFALADRLPIWRTAWSVFKAHPINGVGPRAFRQVYADYAEADDVWQQQNTVALHTHHWVLELLAESGIVGLLLFLLMVGRLWIMCRNNMRNSLIWAGSSALMAAFLPLISLYSLFSSFWSVCLWWWILVIFTVIKND